jgi:uncharacterized protein DUF6894
VARFFFHFVSKDKFIPDPNGRELEDVGAAHGHALLIIEKSVVLLSHEVDWKGWSINVSDASGRVLLSVLFSPNLGKYIGLPQEICSESLRN